MFNNTQQGANMPIKILRMPSVEDASGYANSTLYLRISEGLWTPPVSLGARAVGWPSSEVAALNAARIAGKTADEIRALVKRLVAARVSALAVLEAGSGHES